MDKYTRYEVRFVIYSVYTGNNYIKQDFVSDLEGAQYFARAVRNCEILGPTNPESKLFAEKYEKNSYVKKYEGIFKVTEERLD